MAMLSQDTTQIKMEVEKTKVVALVVSGQGGAQCNHHQSWTVLQYRCTELPRQFMREAGLLTRVVTGRGEPGYSKRT